jgi:hypothetical protein
VLRGDLVPDRMGDGLQGLGLREGLGLLRRRCGLRHDRGLLRWDDEKSAPREALSTSPEVHWHWGGKTDIIRIMSLEPKRLSHWEEKTPQIISAQKMRKGVGRLAILLPVLTALGYCILGGERGGFLDSISESYYTLMRDVFVGTLCAEAFFLYAYRGYNTFEDRLFNVLAVLCCVIALFSMNSIEGAPGVDTAPPPACYDAIRMAPTCLILLNNRVLMSHYEAFGWIHIGAAAVLFISLGYVSYFLFTRTDSANPNPRKLRRNVTYRACGIAIWASLAIYALLALVKVLVNWPLLFIAETICLFAFGFSWLVKGDGVYGLSDSPDQTASVSPQ